MANSFSKGYFPSQVASDSEKATIDYGLKVAKAIEDEWFKRDNSGYRFSSHQNSFHKLRSVSYTHLTLPTKRIV